MSTVVHSKFAMSAVREKTWTNLVGDCKRRVLDNEEFFAFSESLAKSSNGDLEDLVYFLVIKIAFAETGHDIVREATPKLQEMNELNVDSPDEFNDAIVDIRLMILFELMDVQGKGKIAFEEVVKSLLKVTRDMDPAFRKALFCVDKSRKRLLTYRQFFELIMNVEAACPEGVDCHELANGITFSICEPTPKEEMAELFDDNIDHQQFDLEDVESTLSRLEQTRIHRLFSLWDEDGNGYIDFTEFVLGLRKFQEKKEIGATLAECITMMKRFDHDGNQQLDRKEFCQLIAEFASTALTIDVDELVDFMIVETALRENTEEERRYVRRMSGHASMHLSQTEFEAPPKPNLIQRVISASDVGRRLSGEGRRRVSGDGRRNSGEGRHGPLDTNRCGSGSGNTGDVQRSESGHDFANDSSVRSSRSSSHHGGKKSPVNDMEGDNSGCLLELFPGEEFRSVQPAS